MINRLISSTTPIYVKAEITGEGDKSFVRIAVLGEPILDLRALSFSNIATISENLGTGTTHFPLLQGQHSSQGQHPKRNQIIYFHNRFNVQEMTGN